MNHTVEFANPADFENLAAIWRMAFSDTDEFINTFFRTMNKDGYTLVSRESGVAVSSAFLLEAQFVIKGKPYSAYYFYAAATHPNYRGRGHMAAIINEAEKLATERGIDFIILVPAEESLYKYYAKFGFETKFYKRVLYFSRDELSKLAVKPDMTDAFSLNIFETRQTALGLYNFLNWGSQALKFAMYVHDCESGSVAFVSDGYALYNVGKDTVYVKEMCTLSDPGELFTMLLMEDEAEKFTINLPVDDPLHSQNEKTVPEGMCLGLNEEAKMALSSVKHAYIGITLG